MQATLATGWARTHFLDALAIYLYQVWRWIRGNVFRALFFGLVSMAVAFVFNVFLIAFVHDGVGSVPAGSPAMTPQNAGSAGLFWIVAPMVVSGVVSYRLQVGGKRFWRDLRGFPVSIVHLARASRRASLEQALWGFGAAMLISVTLSRALGLFVAAGALLLAGQLLRPVASAFVCSLWRTVVSRVAPSRRRPPADSALVLSLAGAFVALAAGLVFASPVAKIVLGLVAIAGAVLLNRRQPVPPVAAAALILLAVGALWLTGMPHPVFACDGGFSDCGGTVGDWLSCGAGPVLSQAALASILAGPSGFIGSGAGGLDPQVWQNPVKKAYQDYLDQHPGATADDFWNATSAQRAADEALRYEQGQTQADLANLQRLGNAPGQIWQGVQQGYDGLKFAWDYYTSDDPQYQQLRSDTSAGNVAQGALDSAWQATDAGANTLYKLDTALRTGDADTVQQMLNNAGGNMLFQAATAGVTDAVTEGLPNYGLTMAGEAPLPPPVPGLGAVPAAADATTYIGVDGVQVRLPDMSTAPPSTFLPDAPASTTSLQDAGFRFPDPSTLDLQQQALLGGDVVEFRPTGEGVNDAQVVTNSDGSATILKGTSADPGRWDTTAPGMFGDESSVANGAYQASNEQGGYIVSRDLGLGVVPTTAPVTAADGTTWTLQQFADGERLPANQYSMLDQQKMGVLDYVIGNVDRHGANWGSFSDGTPAGWDNGLTFTNPSNISDASNLGARPPVIKSDFVANVLGQPLDPSLLSSLQSVDVNQLAQNLIDAGIPQPNVAQAIARLQEIQNNGMITGEAWAGQSMNAELNGGYIVNSRGLPVQTMTNGTIQRLIDGSWTSVQLPGGDVPSAAPMAPDQVVAPSPSEATTLPQDVAPAQPETSSPIDAATTQQSATPEPSGPQIDARTTPGEVAPQHPIGGDAAQPTAQQTGGADVREPAAAPPPPAAEAPSAEHSAAGTAQPSTSPQPQAWTPTGPVPSLQEAMGNAFYEYSRDGNGLNMPSISDLKANNPSLAPVPDDNLIAIRGYTGADFAPINQALRSGDPAQLTQMQSYIQNIQNGLAQLPDYKGTVYRGAGLSDEAVQAYVNCNRTGILFTDPQVVSTTYDPARMFTGEETVKNRVSFVIESEHGKLVESLAQTDFEREVMFTPGTQFIVVDVIETGQSAYQILLSEMP